MQDGGVGLVSTATKVNKMKIGQTAENPPLRADTGNKAIATRSPAPTKSGEGATISLSALSSQLAALESNMAASGHFDAARVEAIKAAIAIGQFKVNAGAVADKLIYSVRELITQR